MYIRSRHWADGLGSVRCAVSTTEEEAMHNEEERRAVNAVGLLRALAEQAMQENGLADVQGTAAVFVVPSTATAAAAGMDIGTPAYNAAVEQLLEAGALERDQALDRLHEGVAGDPEAFRIRSGGIDLLRKSGAWR